MRSCPLLLVLALSGCGVSVEDKKPDVAADWSGVSSRSNMCVVIHSDLASIYQGESKFAEVNQSYLAGGSGVGNGGDPLRVIFERARGDARGLQASRYCSPEDRRSGRAFRGCRASDRRSNAARLLRSRRR